MLKPGSFASKIAALAILAVIVALPYVLIVAPIMAEKEIYRVSIAQSKELIDRYRDRLVDTNALRAKLREREGEKTLSGAFLKTGSSSLAAAELQGRVGRLVKSTNGRLTSTQSVPSTGKEAFQRVTVRADVKVSTSALRDVLYQLESGTPYLMVDNLVIRSGRRATQRVRRRRVVQPVIDQLDMRFDVYGYLWKTGQK